jgi:hypothetical protein
LIGPPDGSGSSSTNESDGTFHRDVRSIGALCVASSSIA